MHGVVIGARFSPRKLVSSVLVLLVVGGLVDCTTPPTALVLGVGADSKVKGILKQVSVEAKRGSEIRFSQSYFLPGDAELPATLTLVLAEGESASQPIRVTVTGFEAQDVKRIVRSATLGFVKEKTKVLKIALNSSCLDVFCPNGQTCIERGCVDDVVDTDGLPDFISNDVTLGDLGNAGAAQGGTAGSSGSGGAGASGGGGTGGMGGTGGTGGTGGIPTKPDRKVAVGLGSACAVRVDGVYCWGRASYGMITPESDTNTVFVTAATRIDRLDGVITGPIQSISVGYNGACIIDGEDRHLVCWGQDGSSNPTLLGTNRDPALVPGLSGINQVVLYFRGGCYLDNASGENVHCWGYEGNGLLLSLGTGYQSQPIVIKGVQNAVQMAISQGYGMACAVTAEKRVLCWGGIDAQNSPEPDAPHDVGLTNIVEVGLSGDSTLLARDENNQLYVVVRDIFSQQYGAVGPFATSDGNVIESGLSLASSWDTCVITKPNEVTCSKDLETASVTTFLDATVVDLAGSPNDSYGTSTQCALLSNGEVQCWGDNDYAVLGAGPGHLYTEATLVEGVTAVQLASASTTFSTVVAADNNLRVWGVSPAFFGELQVHSDSPIDISSITTDPANLSVSIVRGLDVYASPNAYLLGDLASVYYNQGAINTSGRLLDIGVPISHVTGEQGLDLGYNVGTNEIRAFAETDYPDLNLLMSTAQSDANGKFFSFVDPVKSVHFDTVSSYGTFVCVVTTTNKLFCWGENAYYSLGTNDPNQNVGTPTEVTGTVLTAVDSVCVGNFHGCAVESNTGLVYCWGNNSVGQSDPSGQAEPSVPVLINVPGGALGVSCSGDYSCAYYTTGVKCWGTNTTGTLGSTSVPVGTRAAGVSDVSGLPAGDPIKHVLTAPYHACALCESGAVYCWGSNYWGQAMLPQTGTFPNPQPVQGLNTPSLLCVCDYFRCSFFENSTHSLNASER